LIIPERIVGIEQLFTPLSTTRLLLERDLFAFETRTLAALLGLEIGRASRLLARMERDGLVARLERGKYVLLGLHPEQALSNPLFLGNQFVTPSYISFWSALHFHGFTEQAPRQVFVAVTRAKRPLTWRGTAFRFVRLQPHAFFGYRRETLGGLPVTVADEAKALVDSLALPQYAGGVSEVAKALRNALHGQVSATDLIDYARRLGNASLQARLGYLLEAVGQPADGLTPPTGPVRLDPRHPRAENTSLAGGSTSTSRARRSSPQESAEMLTRAQIQRLAQRSGIGLQAQERDYVQHLLLFLLYGRSQALLFKGGTALRVAYRGNRYSEDLDFNGPPDAAFLQGLWDGVVSGLGDFGLRAEVRNAWQSEVGYSFDVSYQGPLYDGRDRTKVRVDVNLRAEAVESRAVLVTPEYDDQRPFVVQALTLEHLLAEKVRAFLVRGRPRDLYDLWLLTAQGVPLDPDLARAKLVLYDLKPSTALLEQAFRQAATDWESDLRPLLPRFVSWETVAPLRERLSCLLL